MELTQIEPYGILILEPVTCLTDLITATVCFFAFTQLQRLDKTEPEHQYFKYYFLFMGLATTAAGLIGHAFLYLVSFNWKMIGWTFSALAIFSIERSAIHFVKPHLDAKKVRWLSLINVLQTLIFFTVITIPATRSFEAVKINSAIGLIGFVLPLHLWSYRRIGHLGHRQVLLAIFAGILPAITFNMEFTIHKWFNYHDISHVLMAMVIFAMYLGARYLAELEISMASKESQSIQTSTD